ncbi:hypothetical protein RchiOBHm_Chr2g0157671 [Rosa chinensis]|uniref:Uncharacterized protein n=1 Tax=Rosa chinensis TaxID=74649 RepID=A0A2P6S1T0_ROSCH|nr:hypothetical protein RchiOBHm_Chr2g0157671 [Rosa chinensis]
MLIKTLRFVGDRRNPYRNAIKRIFNDLRELMLNESKRKLCSLLLVLFP